MRRIAAVDALRGFAVDEGETYDRLFADMVATNTPTGAVRHSCTGSNVLRPTPPDRTTPD
ncbi:hypothetical protein Drose_28420 [Dactylosporangium roseum]|uniref:Uncharacterized protein n=1 Tax=Dactylosporangium roseum TaxID=47989 RepID=A0ABY5Z2S7_9ACTN|nr:hypothetical protein [Dactylosporangium roseum]UWZ35058.1 hypothetical protein Drose_28420 [Dactylosporangium roseum]